jgi:hypothetical protein
VVAGVLAVTSPWWATVVARHGLSPLQAALGTSSTPPYYLPWIRLVLFTLTPEVFLDIVGVMGLLGALVCAADRQYFLLVWLAVIAVLDPRSSSRYATIPLAMLAEVGLCRVVLPAMRRLGKPRDTRVLDHVGIEASAGKWLGSQLQGVPARVLLALCVVHMLASATSVQDVAQSSLHSLAREEREAMEWVAENTGHDSRFVLVTPGATWAEDSATEWFPALAQRVSLATVQGREWLPGHVFDLGKQEHADLQGCRSEEASCLDAWGDRYGLLFTHVYVSKSEIDFAGSSVDTWDCCASLRHSLTASPDYGLIYDGPGAAVFARQRVTSS